MSRHFIIGYPFAIHADDIGSIVIDGCGFDDCESISITDMRHSEVHEIYLREEFIGDYNLTKHFFNELIQWCGHPRWNFVCEEQMELMIKRLSLYNLVEDKGEYAEEDHYKWIKKEEKTK